MGTLIRLLVAERSGFSPNSVFDQPEIQDLMNQMVKESATSLTETVEETLSPAKSA